MTIKERLAKIRFFNVTPDLSALNVYEWLALSYCVKAAKIMTSIYIKQAAHGNLELYKSLQLLSDEEGIDLLRYFNTQGSPWDEYNNNEPFVQGFGKRPKFGSFYPVGFSTEEWQSWLDRHPEDRYLFESNYTVIDSVIDYRSLSRDLVAVPYSEAYADELGEAADHLRKAAAYLPEGHLRSFLNLRADAFLSNDYFDSDMAWVDTDGNPFEATIGPYEVYFDKLLGLKTSFEAFVALPDKDATAALKKFTPLVPEFDLMLSKEFDFKPKGVANTLEVVSDVIRGGEAAFGYMFVAYNLPNDRRVHDLKGSKKVFSRTMMEAKFNTIARPVAERILLASDVDKCTFDNRLLFVLGHELSHGLGPSVVKIGNTSVPFTVVLKDLHSSIEEAKADMLGTRLLNYFRSYKLIDDRTMLGCLLTEIVAFFQGWMHGFTEAHSYGNLVEYNWLKASGALRYDKATKKFEIDPELCIRAMSDLSTEFLYIEMAGSYKRAKAFMEHWGAVPPELPVIIEGLSDIPTAVSPIYELPV